MPLPSTGAISLSDLRSEFGGSIPTKLNDYYRNAGLVDRTVTAIPTSGTLSLSMFYGTANAINFSVVASKTGSSTGSIVMPTGIKLGDIIIVGWRASDSSPTEVGSGFRMISYAGNDNGLYSSSGTSLSYALATGNESGATISGWSVNSGGLYAVYILRPSRDIRSTTSVDTGSYAGINNSPSYTITTSLAEADATTIAVSVMGSWSTGISGTFSPTTSTILDYTDGNNAIRLYMYIQNPASVTPVDCVSNFNNGNVNSTSTGYIAAR